MNVAKTYLSMMQKQGVSSNDAVRKVCDSVGLSFSPSYASQWADETHNRTIPPAVVKFMQQESAQYAAIEAGAKLTVEQAKKIAELLAPKVRES